MKKFVTLLLLIFTVSFADAPKSEELWLNITLLQPEPYRTAALLVIDEGYDASKQKRASLKYELASRQAASNLLLDQFSETTKQGQLSHHLAIYTIELLGVESVELRPSDFTNLPSDYKFGKPLIAHKPKP